jgi:hypothetical protein
MEDKEKLKFLLHVAIPVSCCIAAGYISFGNIIFMPHMTAFQIITSSLMGTVFLTSLKITSIKNSLAVLFVLFILHETLLIQPSGLDYVIRDVVYFTALSLSVYYFYDKIYLKKPSALYPLYSALVFAVVFLFCLTVFLAVKSFDLGVSVTTNYYYIPVQILINSLIGLGLGTGTFLADKYLPLKKNDLDKMEDEGIE